MMLKIKRPLLLAFLSLVLFSCEKEYSVEGSHLGGGGGGGTAVFSLTGAPGACTNALATGIYLPGTALGATNIVTIEVNVTTPGTYTLSTNTANGITFSGAGTFSVAGTQTIVLSGTGIPAAAGTFDYTAGTNGCSFPVTVGPGGGTGTAVFTYNGAPGACTAATPAGTYTSGTALTSANTVLLNVTVTTLGTYIIATNPVNGFYFSGTGTFSALGPQTVTLTGSGVPTASGTFDFTPTGNGCSFPITVTAGTVATDFLKCTIDGVAKTFNVDLSFDNSTPSMVLLDGALDASITSAKLSIIITKSPAVTTGTYNRAGVGNFTTFCVGSYEDGVSTDIWFTGLLGQSQGFSVTISSYTANRVIGNFSGTLYGNNGQNNTGKVITQGSFSIPY